MNKYKNLLVQNILCNAAKGSTENEAVKDAINLSLEFYSTVTIIFNDNSIVIDPYKLMEFIEKENCDIDNK